jgi:hypothetical protein
VQAVVGRRPHSGRVPLTTFRPPQEPWPRLVRSTRAEPFEPRFRTAFHPPRRDRRIPITAHLPDVGTPPTQLHILFVLLCSFAQRPASPAGGAPTWDTAPTVRCKPLLCDVLTLVPVSRYDNASTAAGAVALTCAFDARRALRSQLCLRIRHPATGSDPSARSPIPIHPPDTVAPRRYRATLSLSSVRTTMIRTRHVRRD